MKPKRRYRRHHDDEVIITRSGGREPAGVVSLREYEALKETAYLLSSLANARRLAESIENVRAGRIQARGADFGVLSDGC